MSSEQETREAVAAAKEAGVSAEGRDNMDKIRDLLFGSQVRDMEAGLARLEERLLREMGTIREEFRSRLETLESFVRTELETLSEQLGSEKDQRSEAVKDLAAELAGTVKAFDQKVRDLDKQSNAVAKDLRDQLHAQSKRLTDEAVKRQEEAIRAFQDTTNRIRAEYVDRSDLSRLFTQVAVRLNAALADSLFSGGEEK
ncbi:MAG: hypothetical protein V1792_06540 [Pseudomonadota bacterium]